VFGFIWKILNFVGWNNAYYEYEKMSDNDADARGFDIRGRCCISGSGFPQHSGDLA
jgi:hypothetical protein